MAEVIALRKAIIADDVAAGLRGLADRLEAGELDYPVTTCIVLTGHTADKLEDGVVLHRSDHDMWAYGPRCDTFTIRGLIATAARD